MSGYFSPEGKTVTWRGQTAVYAPVERAIMRELPVLEQAVIHLLKAFTQGDISTPVLRTDEPNAQAQAGGLTVSAVPDAYQETPKTFIDADEIVFGEGLTISGKRKRPIYALVWTWRQHRIHKTKKKCEQKMRAWKRWKERQGWKVSNHDTGYFAFSPQGERHSISLHEYDAETKERLK